MRQHYVRILFIFQRQICRVLLFLKTDENEFSSIWKWIICCNDVMNHVDCVICYGRPLLAAWLLSDLNTIPNQRTDSPESRLEGNGLGVFTFFCSNLLKVFKIQNNLSIRQYYMQEYF